jgi:aminoglycoside phosphotransferase (APT) family kinase protein
MATIGDPLMELGTSLAYWIEPGDSDVLHELDFGPTLLPGNYSRKELLSAYEERTGTEVEDAVFYYVYGLYKVAVIAQQIYYRYKQGHTDDPRFRLIIFAVQALAQTANEAIKRGDISPQTSSSQ